VLSISKTKVDLIVMLLEEW